MSKKHFAALASAMNRSMPDSKCAESTWVQWRMDIRAIADVCSAVNPRFDRERFIAACEVE